MWSLAVSLGWTRSPKHSVHMQLIYMNTFCRKHNAVWIMYIFIWIMSKYLYWTHLQSVERSLSTQMFILNVSVQHSQPNIFHLFSHNIYSQKLKCEIFVYNSVLVETLFSVSLILFLTTQYTTMTNMGRQRHHDWLLSLWLFIHVCPRPAWQPKLSLNLSVAVQIWTLHTDKWRHL